MSLKSHFLVALTSLGAALLSINAQAQSLDSTSVLLPRIVVTQAKDSAKGQPKTFRMISKSSLPAGNEPLYIVDGQPIQRQDLQLINPNDIDKINIMKDAPATAIYGSRGANGVVLITMKHPPVIPPNKSKTKKGPLN